MDLLTSWVSQFAAIRLIVVLVGPNNAVFTVTPYLQSKSFWEMSLFNKLSFYPTLFYNVFMTKATARKWFDRIDETVVLGALPFRGMTKWLYNEENIRAVVTLNEDWELEDFSNSEEEWRAWGIEQLKIPTVDFTGTPAQTDIDKAVDFILGHRVKHNSVYVHCKAGRTRSATVVACYLVKLHGWTSQEAVDLVQKKRPHIWLRDKQWDSIEQYYKACVNQKTRSGG